MTAFTGAATNIGLKLNSYGYGIAFTTGDKLQVDSLDFNANVQPLINNPIGGGLEMIDGTDSGPAQPSGTFTKKAGYNDAGTAAEALFFAGASVGTTFPTVYCHSFLYEAAHNAKSACIAWEECVGSIVEYATCAPVKLTVTAQPKNYLMQTIDWIASNYAFSGTDTCTNTHATAIAATVANTQRIIVKDTDTFRINAQAGAALAAGDNKAIKQVVIEYSRTKEMPLEIKGSAGLGTSIATGQPPFDCTVTVTFREETDFLWKEFFKNGTELKAALNITGPTLLTSTYLKEYSFPRLKIIEEPDYALTSPGINGLVVKFKAMVAASNPTGMISTYPYVRTQNDRSTSYMA